MRTVRLKNNTVVEIIPEYAHPVEYWYGSAFAAQWRKLWRRLMKPLSRSLRARPNRNLSTHSRTMRCWIYMKC